MKYQIFLSIVLSYSIVNAQDNSIHLTTDQKSSYRIILSDSASHWDSIAANELRHYINEISGATIPILSDSSQVEDREIIIGKNNRSGNLDLSLLKSDGFIIKTDRDKIYLVGNKGKGTLNAMYAFLEKYLNCRMYSSKVKIIPKQKSIVIPQINDVENPVFSYRSVHYYDAMNDEFCRWHKLVDSEDKKMWGMFVHTFKDLLPPEKYFNNHPEYFAFRNGVRIKDQPCLSNPDVFRIMADELRKRMKENPDAEIWSVSQNDNYSCCQCSECAGLDEAEGSQSASIINFVNRIAGKFPEKTISTLAYQYSRKPPRTIKPDPNVNIMLCSIEASRNKPLEADTSGDSFIHDLREWSELTANIIVWDYVVQFTNLISPFPNFHVLQPNILSFAKNHVPMIFEQGAGNRIGTEFGEFRTYLIAKLLWNPFINIDSVMNDFLNGYYGKAGKYIRDYIDLMTNQLIKTNLPRRQAGAQLLIYGNPVLAGKDYLTPELINEYNHLFDKAEGSVSNEDHYLDRVKNARLPLKYAMLEQAKTVGEGEWGTVTKIDSFSYIPNRKIINLLEEFSAGCKKIGNQSDSLSADKAGVFINEKQLDIDTYVMEYRFLISKTMKNPIGLFKKVKYITEPSPKYPANGLRTLTDGMRGDENYYFNWQGFEGDNMEVILDLGKATTVKKISVDFLQVILSWIFLPKQIEVSISEDEINFKTVASVKNTEPLERNDVFIHTFNAEFNPVQIRYLKIKAENIKVCPPWHIGHPFKAWIFTDEVVIE